MKEKRKRIAGIVKHREEYCNKLNRKGESTKRDLT